MDKPVDQKATNQAENQGNNGGTGSNPPSPRNSQNRAPTGSKENSKNNNNDNNNSNSSVRPLRSVEEINNEIEAQKKNPEYLTAKANVHARRATIGADLSGAVQGASWATTSLLVFVDKWRHFLDQKPTAQAAGIYLLPIAILAQGFEAMFDWVAFRNQKNAGQKGWQATLAKAITNTLSFGAMLAATVGALAFAAAFTVAAPALMTAALAAKSVYHFGASIYYQYKVNQLSKKDDANLKEIAHFRHLRDDNALLGIGTGLVAAGFGLVSFLSNPVFAILGAIGGVFSVAMGLGNAWMNYSAKAGSGLKSEKKIHPDVLEHAVEHKNTHKNGKEFMNSLHQERAAAMAAEKQKAKEAPAADSSSISITVSTEPKKSFWATRCAKNDTQQTIEIKPIEIKPESPRSSMGAGK